MLLELSPELVLTVPQVQLETEPQELQVLRVLLEALVHVSKLVVPRLLDSKQLSVLPGTQEQAVVFSVKKVVTLLPGLFQVLIQQLLIRKAIIL